MYEAIQPVIQNFIVTVLTAMLGVLSTLLIILAKKGLVWATEKINGLKDDRAAKVLNTATNNLFDIVSTTVESLQQTLGDEIRASIKSNDGKYSREDLLALKDKAFVAIKSQLTDSAKEALSTAYADLDTFIRDLIEAKVHELKNDLISSVTSSKALLG